MVGTRKPVVLPLLLSQCRKGFMGPKDMCPGVRMREGAGTPREEYLGTAEDCVEGKDQQWAKGRVKVIWGGTSV